MDRLSAVAHAPGLGLPEAAMLVAASGLIFGCERAGDERAAPAGGERVAAVAAPEDRRTLEDLCDVLPAPESAPELAYPPLSDDSAEPPADGWRWVNVWATWCEPCVEEIPMLREWEVALAGKGAPVEVVFLSVDETPEAIETYREEHPDAPSEYRAARPEDILDWVAELGLAGGGSLPVHIVADGDDRVRCLRAGKVTPHDLPLVERLLGGEAR